MRTKFWSGVGVLASIAASVSAANAADLAVQGPVYKAPPVILSDWSGLYLGIDGGYGWGDIPNVNGTGIDVKQTGGLIGGHVGYNWQFGSVVVGVEGDYDGADIKQTVSAFNPSATFKTDELASARVRLGYTVLPNLLAYGTAGAGWGHQTLSQTGGTAGYSQSGWAAGAGLEYKFYGNWSARAEYLHYDFGNGDPVFSSGDNTVDVVRGGVSYKF
jgi:outer membrane immunogenic protein